MPFLTAPQFLPRGTWGRTIEVEFRFTIPIRFIPANPDRENGLIFLSPEYANL
jgi:hypothetical protein